MIQRMLEGDYSPIELIHVRMAFSREMDEIGHIRFQKIIELFRVIAHIWYVRLRQGADVLYYPPAGPDLIPVIRDIIILLFTRWLYPKTIFHFHASGLSTIYPHLPALLRPLFRKAYFHPDIGIRLSPYTPEDAQFLGAKQEFIVPYGIPDAYPPRASETGSNATVHILFVGVLRESKGVLVLLEACRVLRDMDLDFHVHIMGKFESEAFKKDVHDAVSHFHLSEYVTFLGVQTGDVKFDTFAHADIFCFPTHFESEALSVVLLEALSFHLPIVATRWRGLPSLVTDGDNGFLVPIKTPTAVADKLASLIKDPELRRRMGSQSRKRYLSSYTVTHYHERLHHVFMAAA